MSFGVYPAAWGQSLSSHTASSSPPPQSQTLRPLGAERQHGAVGRAGGRSPALKGAARKNSSAARGMEKRVSPNTKSKCGARRFPPMTNSREEMEGAWNKGCLYYLLRVKCEKPQVWLDLGCKTPLPRHLPVQCHPTERLQPYVLRLLLHRTASRKSWEGTPQDRSKALITELR